MSRSHSARCLGTAIAAPLIATLAFGQAPGQTTASFVPFHQFLENVRVTSSTEALAKPAVKVRDSVALEEMRRHILTMYNGVNVTHSYVLGSQTYDCVPVTEQPSVRALGLAKIATAPPHLPASPALEAGEKQPRALSQLPEGQTQDEFGNTLGCEDHTIPMARITLEQLSRFPTLHEFFQKGPNGAGQPFDAGNVGPPATAAHKYSFTYQYVNNLGPSTNINLWRPYVYTDVGEIFSLAQLWTIGYSSAPVQTAEAGWQNYPAFYGTENSALFIYWTADGYNATGCYNLTCAGFVQTSSSYHLGVGFTTYSQFDGPQYEIKLQYYLYYGNWWLNVGGTWVGYYPASIYKAGDGESAVRVFQTLVPEVLT